MSWMQTNLEFGLPDSSNCWITLPWILDRICQLFSASNSTSVDDNAYLINVCIVIFLPVVDMIWREFKN